MTLRALPGGTSDPPPPSERARARTPAAPGSRVLAPGAPPSPGTAPLELAKALRDGEPVLWWNSKERIDRRAVGWTLLAGLLLLGVVSLFAPGLWAAPWKELWPTIVVPILPALLVAFREWMSCRSTLVTDTSIVDEGPRGDIDRLAFRNVSRIRRDFLTGGVLLEGKAHRVRIPPTLSEDARAAVALARRNTLRGEASPDDRLGWMP